MYTVYILRWDRTSQTYIGMTKNPIGRMKQHLSKRSDLYDVIKKYGIPCMEPLATNLSRKLAVQLEAYYIEELNSHNGRGGNGFNIIRMFDSCSGVRK